MNVKEEAKEKELHLGEDDKENLGDRAHAEILVVLRERALLHVVPREHRGRAPDRDAKLGQLVLGRFRSHQIRGRRARPHP